MVSTYQVPCPMKSKNKNRQVKKLFVGWEFTYSVFKLNHDRDVWLSKLMAVDPL